VRIIELIKEFVFTICQIIFKKEFFIWKINGNKAVALTFDDGPDQDFT
jgi:peptidoglycan/xylan/chitin deacetylase (PgdA/CDA1 family)